MKLTRRDFIKANAAAAAATVAGITLPISQEAQAQARGADGIRWDKGVCRYCGTGCGVLVGTKGGRVVATQGDPDAPVNKGLNCIKGYFLSKIMYGKDRLSTPLLRIEGLDTAYGASQVLFGLDLEIRAGEVVTLLGRNGMGKTTTVRSIMGLTRARGGAISVIFG